MSQPTTSPNTAAQPAGTIVLVPTEQLRESPFNPRKHYNQAALQELADSIKAQGILQAIVIRPLPESAQDIWVRYEIVFGHRRYRAAVLAGLAAVRAEIRPYSDEEAALAQVAENLQREDVTPFEEADSFARLHSTHGMTADAIAAGVNKSRSYVYGRLKLAKVAPEVRAAVAEEGLGAETALEVARLPSHGMQKVALRRLKLHGDEWLSYRDAKRQIRHMFCSDTTEAPFDLHDATLVRHAGPCHTCPKLAGNDPDLQGVLDAGVCTDSECFDGKTSEHFRIELIAMRNQGHRTLRNDEAEAFDSFRTYTAPQGYTAVAASAQVGSSHVDYSEMLTKLAEAGQEVPKTLAVHRQGWPRLREYLTDPQAEQVVAAYRALVGQADDDAHTDSPASGPRGPRLPAHAQIDRSSWTQAELAVVDPEIWRQVKHQVLARLAVVPRSTDDMRVILLRELDLSDDLGPMAQTMGLTDECDAAEEAWRASSCAGVWSERTWWEAKLASLGADQLAALMVGVALWDMLGNGGYHTLQERAARSVALAERYGVDVAAAARLAAAEAASQADTQAEAASAPAGQQIDAFGMAA